MNTSEPKAINLSKEEFETFLLIYAAHVDYNYSDQEKTFILARTTQDVLEKMENIFFNYGDYSCMKIILQHKEKHYSCEKEKERIFLLLKKIFEIDGDYSRIEKSFIDFFKKMIEI